MSQEGSESVADLYDILDVRDAEARFGVSEHVDYPFQEYGDEQETRHYAGGLRIDGDLTSDTDEDDFCLANVIVDGDLVVDGNLEWIDEGSGSFLLVTGDLRARNLILRGNPSVVVLGDLSVEGTLLGHLGDDGGYLTVLGGTRAEIVLLLNDFRLRACERPRAVLAGAPGLFPHPVDISDRGVDTDGEDMLGELLLPELVDEGQGVDNRKVEAAVRSGRPLFREDTDRAGPPRR
ncbi:polymer-forming cytoskeletal protein [Streptomyces sp. NPDC000983]|uniref:polymer-forming cytoskeletal protein n=1 Tax=Streptomyces sp. NPDC000983 TaxID=3154373 RepID=UPI00331964CF